jgi:hypothetical protein
VPRVDPVQVALAAAVVALVAVMFAAPLVLGTYVVAQRATERLTRVWFGALLALMLLVLLAAAAGLVIEALF